jgi:hypothetical protein
VRKALNENPIVQVALIGLLVIVVGVLFVSRMGGDSAPPATTPSQTTATPTAAVPADTTASPAITETPAAESAGTVPSDAAAPVADDGFVAGPGLPEAVVEAYDSGSTVALLIGRKTGVDDKRLALQVLRSNALAGTVLFTVEAKEIADYSRITRGVDVDRVPALVVIKPKRLTEGPMPEATVSYGYRGFESIEQAVRDATYSGRDDLPYYPE